MILPRHLAPSLRSYQRLQRLLKHRQLPVHPEVRLPLCLLPLLLPLLLRQARLRRLLLLNHLPRLCHHRLLRQNLHLLLLPRLLRQHPHLRILLLLLLNHLQLLLLLSSLPQHPLRHHRLLNHHHLLPHLPLFNQLRQLHLFQPHQWHLILQRRLLLSSATPHLHFRYLIQALKGPTLPLQLLLVAATMALSLPALRLQIPLLWVAATTINRRHHQPETITTLAVEAQKPAVAQGAIAHLRLKAKTGVSPTHHQLRSIPEMEVNLPHP